MQEEFKVVTYVGSSYKHGDWFTSEIMEFVRDAKTEQDALWNLKSIMAAYERRKTFKQKLLDLFNN